MSITKRVAVSDPEPCTWSEPVCPEKLKRATPPLPGIAPSTQLSAEAQFPPALALFQVPSAAWAESERAATTMQWRSSDELHFLDIVVPFIGAPVEAAQFGMKI